MEKKKYVGKNSLSTIFDAVDAKISNATPKKVSELLNDSNFATKEDVQEAVNNINVESDGITKESVEEMLGDYAKTDEVNTLLEGYLKEEGLAGYAQTTDVEEKIENLKGEIDEKFLKVADFVTEEEIEEILGENLTINGTTSDLAILKSVVQQLIATNANKAVDNSGVTSENNVIVTGKFTGDSDQYAIYKSTEGDVTVYGLDASDSPIQLYAAKGDITATEITLTGSMGTGYGTDSVTKRNAMTVYGGGENIIFKNVILDGECYNGIFVNNNAEAVAKNLTFEDIAILNTNNNAILVLALEDDGELNIKNVSMGNVKNAIRLSNHTNSKHPIAQGVVVNIENVDVTEAREKFLLLEDYVTRKNPDEDLTTDQFKDIVINIKNCTFNGSKITADMDVDDFCHLVIGKPSLGTDIEMPYAQYPELYPTFNIV